ncbi:MAG: hypothetical protein COX79_02245 [Candidatus Levybacteria bacterium CG_4_10_14_0_2_um_filter_36_16]|nr:MAG: hypothetical protein AUK12_00760 [Candidatus Levybacteria bacterium CG2_30_37_29]PIR78849.1 MAG: hypothetical protein COU26_04475 [Candidatus Levybacteria bacterium CG10_big_fil_rev_8_21_14_0_10_36_30]PIZ97443.1 MAG: hypothetical protein COX79_02245 [Candidatus Levybacteria bacterium CG_4_10_14_0_2_um_filter_36_16]
MKIQDILFLITLLVLIYKKDSRILIVAGILCLLLALPFFSFWIFFTAQRLVYYAAGFFLLAVLFLLVQSRDK